MTERYKPNTTVACVIEAQGKFLLVEELIDGKVKYNQPAGHLEAHESIIDACIREVKEETGLSIEPQGLVGIYQFTASESLAFVRYTFYLKLNQVVRSTPEDPAINGLKWCSFDEITALSSQLRSPLVIESISDYLAGKNYDLSLINNDYF
ncbi:NUDIX hydrolase [Shewanella halifaxensis HAW-EB4]|uniref:Phosphatase NudJ n=1 Tax=Shewanella halifaxensis (strain HAW-EB4) TaxID=458817 RepID=B0TQ03_SHEHH|nr:NUDIX hydrolase [Shewanella halifaxensis]ABZ76282.1 NUDIX hydrolase [Shewanella halifaxensis HAW-EB4]